MSESVAMALKLAKIKLKLPVLRRCSTKGSSCGSQLALQLRALRLGLLAEAALKRQLLLGFLEFTEPVAGRRHVSGSAIMNMLLATGGACCTKACCMHVERTGHLYNRWKTLEAGLSQEWSGQASWLLIYSLPAGS